MKYTNQEIKNKRNFIISLFSLPILLMLFMYSLDNKYIILFSLSVGLLTSNILWMFYIGYSHGWELKRISQEK